MLPNRRRITALPAWSIPPCDAGEGKHWRWLPAVSIALETRCAGMRGQSGLPIILEVFYPFEASDEFVLRDARSSMALMLGLRH